MLTANDFRAEIESFLERSGMSATAFGKVVVGDPSFVHDVRAGRMPSLRLVEKVQTFIRDWQDPITPPPAEASAA